MLKNLAIVLGLVAGLSACMGPYGYNGYSGSGYGRSTPVYYGGSYYSDTPNEPTQYGAMALARF